MYKRCWSSWAHGEAALSRPQPDSDLVEPCPMRPWPEHFFDQPAGALQILESPQKTANTSNQNKIKVPPGNWRTPRAFAKSGLPDLFHFSVGVEDWTMYWTCTIKYFTFCTSIGQTFNSREGQSPFSREASMPSGFS